MKFGYDVHFVLVQHYSIVSTFPSSTILNISNLASF